MAVENMGARFSRFTNNTLVGRSLKYGTMESFGMNIEGFGRNAVNKGFLGTGLGASAAGKAKLLEEATEQAGKGIGKGFLSKAGSLAFKSIPLAFTAYSMYEGYKQEGVWGATKGMVESAAYSAAFHYVGAAIGGTAMMATGILAAGAAAGYAGYTLGEAGRAHAKGLRQLEMGQQDQIQAALGSAGAATMRQRSLMALNNTHLNGRMALGSEGFLMHRSFGGY